jgi:methylated-DNA-[protein]-cysteine S-methyltransferase
MKRKAVKASLEAPRVSPFQGRVYDLVSTVPRGCITTYSAVAKQLGTCARAVGGAMRRNPYPCSVMP